MTQDLTPKSSLLSRTTKPEARPRHKPSASSATTPLQGPADHVSMLLEYPITEQDTRRDLPEPRVPIGPCAAALPQVTSPVAVRSPIAVRKTPGGAMHLGPEAARLYTPAEAVGLAREILRLFS